MDLNMVKCVKKTKENKRLQLMLQSILIGPKYMNQIYKLTQEQHFFMTVKSVAAVFMLGLIVPLIIFS